MPDWYYRDTQDRTVGPIKPSDLLSLIRGGEISEETLVRKDNSPWVRSVEINGLWNAASRPDTEFSCPVCNASISKPPVRCPSCMKYIDKAVGKIKSQNVSAKQLQRMRQAATAPQQPSNNAARLNRATVENSHVVTASTAVDNAQKNTRWWSSLFGRRKGQ